MVMMNDGKSRKSLDGYKGDKDVEVIHDDSPFKLYSKAEILERVKARLYETPDPPEGEHRILTFTVAIFPEGVVTRNPGSEAGDVEVGAHNVDSNDIVYGISGSVLAMAQAGVLCQEDVDSLKYGMRIARKHAQRRS